MMYLWGLLGLIWIVLFVMFLALCKAGTDADEWAERELRRMTERQKGRRQDADGLFYEKVTDDAGEA